MAVGLRLRQMTVDEVIIEGAATIGEIYHWATWAMPPPLI